MEFATPAGLVAMEWRDLLFATWPADPMATGHLAPSGTELDLWDGQALLSLVAWRVRGLQVGGVRLPLLQDFDQVNFRTAVKRVLPGEIRRGVVSIRQIVPSSLVTLGARLLFNENYLAAPTRREITSGEKGWTQYEWMIDGRWNRLAAVRSGEHLTPGDGSLEAFVEDRPWGYTRQPDGSTIQHQLEHPRWQVLRTDEMMLDCDVARLFGPEYVPILSRQPLTAFVATGSAVTVLASRPI